MKNKCISTHDLLFWGLATYAAYTALLYVFRKPVCQYTANLCERLNREQL